MKKRGIFSLVLLLALSTLTAAQQDVTDLGTAYELVIASDAIAEAETNTASSVSVVTKEQIESYNAQSTAELVGKAIGVSFNSVGSLGALQTVVIRGASSSKNLIYLDGVLISSAHNGSVDLSIIPVDIIDHIEIIKSGPGNLGRTNAIGGMVNIITKKGEETETPFSLTFENGSFLPLSQGTEDKHNWLSLVDSQKLDFSYTTKDLVATVGGLAAQNAYTYEDSSSSRVLRDNAQVYAAHGSVNYAHALSDTLQLNTQNVVSYKNLGVPGSASGLTANDFQKDFLFNTNNTILLSDINDTLNTVTALFGYSFGQTEYYTEDGDGDTVGNQSKTSIHNKHKASAQLQGTWDLGQSYSLDTDLLYSLDYVDSTDVGQKARHTISTSANGSIYFMDGSLSLHPSLNVAYLSDLNTLSPNASLGAIYAVLKDLDLKATISYAENTPTFSQLYYPGYCNPDLKTEKGINADLSVSIMEGPISYEGTLFGRNIYNAIVSDSYWVPQNIAHSVYLGAEQTLGFAISDLFSIQASYLYNKSFDLSGGNTFADNVEVTDIRKHTAKSSLFVTLDRLNAAISGEYLGKTSSLDSVFLLNISMNMQITEELKAYLAIDNVLNTAYELSVGYPMPGTKIRIGGTLRF